MKYYFVSYSYTTTHGSGFGETWFESEKFFDLFKAREYIRKSIGVSSVIVILFFSEITKEMVEHFEE